MTSVVLFAALLVSTSEPAPLSRSEAWALCGEKGEPPRRWTSYKKCPKDRRAERRARRLERKARRASKRSDPLNDTHATKGYLHTAEIYESPSAFSIDTLSESSLAIAQPAFSSSLETSVERSASSLEPTEPPAAVAFSSIPLISFNAVQACESGIDSVELVTHGEPIRLGSPFIAQAESCDSSSLITWTINGGDPIGSGDRINVVATSTTVTVIACQGSASGSSNCAQASLNAAVSRPQIEITAITYQGDLGWGDSVRIDGWTDGLVGSGAILALYKHTDVFYRHWSDPVLQADGSFSIVAPLAKNVDRIAIHAFASGFDANTRSGCWSNLCLGEWDEAGRLVPLEIDDTEVLAETTTPMPRSSLSDVRARAIADRLFSKTVSGANQPARFVRSFVEKEVGYLYDQASSAIALLALGEMTEARTILNALANRQRSDGSWYAVYDRFGADAASQDLRFGGANAWSLLAFAQHRSLTNDPRYLAIETAAIQHLTSQLVSAGSGRAPRFNPTDLSSTGWNESTVTSLEHAIDSYAALRIEFELGHPDVTNTHLADLEDYIRGMWSGERFYAGTIDTGALNTTEIYLDVQGWAMLALDDDSYANAVDFTCDTLYEPAVFLPSGEAGVAGWAEYQSTLPKFQVETFAWTEGTFGFLLSIDQVVSPSTEWAGCDGMSQSQIAAGIASLGADPGTIPYATANSRGFTRAASTATAAWLTFYELGFNPFANGG